MLIRDNQDFCQDLSRRSLDLLRRSLDLSRNLNIVEAFWVWKWWKVSTDWEISTWKYKNPRTSQSRSRQTVKKRQNFQISTNFLISIETFWSGRWCRDEIEKSWSRSRFSRLSRLTLWRRRDKSRPPRLIFSQFFLNFFSIFSQFFLNFFWSFKHQWRQNCWTRVPNNQWRKPDNRWRNLGLKPFQGNIGKYIPNWFHLISLAVFLST